MNQQQPGLTRDRERKMHETHKTVKQRLKQTETVTKWALRNGFAIRKRREKTRTTKKMFNQNLR